MDVAAVKHTMFIPPILFLILIFHCAQKATCNSYPSSILVNYPTSWINNHVNEMGTWNFSDGSSFSPFLHLNHSDTPGFDLGFFSDGIGAGKLFYLVVLLNTDLDLGSYSNVEDLPVVIWSANRDNPVQENAFLDFAADGNLVLKDVDDRLVWSTNTSRLSVNRLMLTAMGNLLLLDAKNDVIWQSFDYPTNTWLPNQNISFGKRLVANNSSSSIASGQFYLSVTRSDISAFIGPDDPQKYHSSVPATAGVCISKLGPCPDFFSTHARFTVDVRSKGFDYLVLTPKGQLNLYRVKRNVSDFRLRVNFIGDFFFDASYQENCMRPTVCGNYGVCYDGQCSCAGGNGSYFVQLHELQPALGCQQLTPLSCENSSLHTFLELKNVTYFDFEPLQSMVDVESCKKECLKSCSCKAALFRYDNGNSYGQCSLLSKVYSLKVSNDGSNYYAFVKVQRSDDQKLENKRARNRTRVIVPTLLVSNIVIAMFVLSACAYNKMRRKSNNVEDMEDEVVGALRRFTFLELKCATRDFQTRLGRGGFGSVFLGILGDAERVAVKCLDSVGQGRKEFLAEVNTIGNIHHSNLVNLIGYCADKSNRLLVYEHMCNGSLDKWIFNQDPDQTLNWEIRHKIIIGVAKGLEYLHVYCNPNIIHFDIKPQNILVDENFNVKISDFGLAKLIDKDQSQVLTVIKGTPGYVAPEVLKGMNISFKVDVYSLGIVILEILFGRRNLDSSYSETLIDTVREHVDKNQLQDLLDGKNEGMECHKEQAFKMMKIAIWCLQAHDKRPFMPVVVKVLEGLLDMEYTADYQMPALDHEVNLAASTNSNPPTASILSGPSSVFGFCNFLLFH